MKKLLILASFLASVQLVNAQMCCNVVDGSGVAIVSSNGLYVIAPSSLPEICTADTDGDGVLDMADKCPTEAGLASNDGCPELASDEVAVLKAALQGVKFKTNSDELLPESNSKLDKVYDLLTKHPDFKLKISGYSDNTGESSYNVELSEKRAKSAKGYLVKRGIVDTRITAKGYGEANAIADNSTPEGRATNRRVEFEIVYD